MVIPVHNASETLSGVVRQFIEIHSVNVEVVLVDDNSNDGTTAIVQDLAKHHRQVVAKFHRTNRGAGVARNTGFAEATGRYTIFFDADDIVHPSAIETGIPLLDSTGADTAIFPYRYQRGSSSTSSAMNTEDIKVWREYARSSQAPHRVVELTKSPRLLRMSAYPWNKVIRTEHFERHCLRFGSTPVHNDILGHWHSLLFARSILLVDSEICTHIVEESGANLSNRRDMVRMTIVDALDETYDLLQRHPGLRNRYSHFYWASAISVISWAQSRISPDHTDEFRARVQQHLLRVNLADFTRMRMKRSPGLADSMLEWITR